MYTPFKYIIHEHLYQLKRYKVDANLDASDKVISGKEPSSEMLTSLGQKLE